MNTALVQNSLVILITTVGSFFDIKFRRIPNWLTFGAFGLILLANIFSFKFGQVLQCLAGYFVGLLLLIVPYIMGGMGAGDVKLLATVGSLVGYKSIILIFLYSSLAGAILGLIWISLKPGNLKFMITTGSIPKTVDKKEKIPYAIAIFIGSLAYVILGKGIFSGFSLWQ